MMKWRVEYDDGFAKIQHAEFDDLDRAWALYDAAKLHRHKPTIKDCETGAVFPIY